MTLSWTERKELIYQLAMKCTKCRHAPTYDRAQWHEDVCMKGGKRC